MRWSKIIGIAFITIAVVFMLILGGGYIGLALYDWNKLKPMIVKSLENATGRKVAIQGDVHMELDVSPTVAVSDISIQNAKWGSRPEMMNVSYAELEISLLSLFDKRIEIDRILIREPNLIIETSDSGESNFQPVAGEQKSNSPERHFQE